MFNNRCICNVHGSAVHVSPKFKTTHMSVNCSVIVVTQQRMNAYNIHTYNMNTSYSHTREQKKPSHKTLHTDFIYKKYKKNLQKGSMM